MYLHVEVTRLIFHVYSDIPLSLYPLNHDDNSPRTTDPTDDLVKAGQQKDPDHRHLPVVRQRTTHSLRTFSALKSGAHMGSILMRRVPKQRMRLMTMCTHVHLAPGVWGWESRRSIYSHPARACTYCDTACQAKLRCE